MELIEKITDELLAMPTEDRLGKLKEIGFFIQSVSTYIKANNPQDNPLLLIMDADDIDHTPIEDVKSAVEAKIKRVKELIDA